MEYGPNVDLCSILLRLIDGRSGKSDVIKVKSHLGDVGPSVIQKNKMAFHHMLANSLADLVAEETAKRLLPDMNSEQKSKRTELTGVSVAKRGWLGCPNAKRRATSSNLMGGFGPVFIRDTDRRNRQHGGIYS